MKKIFGIVAFILFGAITLACGMGSATDDDANRLNDIAGENTTVPTSPDTQSQIGDGMWKVAKKTDFKKKTIAPGTYDIVALEDGVGCYYETLRGFSGELSDVRSNGNVAPGMNTTMTVKPTDKALQLKYGCLAKKSS